MLDFMGDLGGLFDALKDLTSFIISPVATFAIKVAVMANLQNH